MQVLFIMFCIPYREITVHSTEIEEIDIDNDNHNNNMVMIPNMNKGDFFLSRTLEREEQVIIYIF